MNPLPFDIPPGEHAARASHMAEDLFRHEGARIVAILASHFGVNYLQLAEDVVQEHSSARYKLGRIAVCRKIQLRG